MKNNSDSLLVGSGALVFWALVLAMTVAFNMFAVFAFSSGSNSVGEFLTQLLMHVISILFLLFVTFLTNRSCSLVRLRGDSLESRALFFGSRKKMKVASVQKITKVFFPADGAYYVLEDGSETCVDRTKWNSQICIPCSERGMEFIRRFYDGHIPPWWTDAPCP